MINYIPADKLIAEVKALKRRKGFLPFENMEITEAYMARGVQFTCDDIVNLIQSLKQDQPKVDLEKELDKFYGMYRKDGKTYDITDDEEVCDWKEDGNSWFKIEFARYFYELGLNTRKEE